MGRDAVQNGIHTDSQCCGRTCCLHLQRNPTAVVTTNYQTIQSTQTIRPYTAYKLSDHIEHTNPAYNVKPLANYDKLVHVLLEISYFHAMQLVTTSFYRATTQKSEISLSITLPPTSVTVLNTTFRNHSPFPRAFYLYYQSHSRSFDHVSYIR